MDSIIISYIVGGKLQTMLVWFATKINVYKSLHCESGYRQYQMIEWKSSIQVSEQKEIISFRQLERTIYKEKRNRVSHQQGAKDWLASKEKKEVDIVNKQQQYT
jgi:hypothetical protein